MTNREIALLILDFSNPRAWARVGGQFLIVALVMWLNNLSTPLQVALVGIGAIAIAGTLVSVAAFCRLRRICREAA